MKQIKIDIQTIEKEWASQGFHGGLWVDLPGQVWKDYIHEVDELVMLVKGRVEIVMDGAVYRLKIGEELLIPGNTYHTVRTVGKEGSRWLYAYRT